MISKEEVKHIAKLARLELKDSEVEKMQKDLSEILEYFDLLKKAPKMKESSLNFKDIQTITRIDEIKEKDSSMADKLVAQAPDKKDSSIKVKSIL